MESLHSLLRMHADQELQFPLSRPSATLSPAMGGGEVRERGPFMESRHSVASAPGAPDRRRPNVRQASRLPRERASASGMTIVPQASPLGGQASRLPYRGGDPRTGKSSLRFVQSQGLLSEAVRRVGGIIFRGILQRELLFLAQLPRDSGGRTQD